MFFLARLLSAKCNLIKISTSNHFKLIFINNSSSSWSSTRPPKTNDQKIPRSDRSDQQRHAVSAGGSPETRQPEKKQRRRTERNPGRRIGPYNETARRTGYLRIAEEADGTEGKSRYCEGTGKRQKVQSYREQAVAEQEQSC